MGIRVAEDRDRVRRRVEPQRYGDLVIDLLAIAHEGVRLQSAAERAIAGCGGPETDASARECGRLLARYYRLRGELASLPLSGPLLRFRGEMDTLLLCHQFFLHEAAIGCHREPADLRSGLGLQAEWLRNLRDEILGYVPQAEDPVGTAMPADHRTCGPRG
ncbi:hypothetical protein [Actinoallomurus acaciae]|uniref:Uncharacterized protein n=1 Tax=Actinoallomurus acaciae TaxID=502577 RepID=A0ABV5Y930_9ACTN